MAKTKRVEVVKPLSNVIYRYGTGYSYFIYFWKIKIRKSFLLLNLINYICIMDFKQKIKEKGLKQNWIANKLGLSDGLFSFYLSGDRTMPDEIKKKLIEVLK